MAWLSGWGKRKKITLAGGASGAQTDYQVKLAVTYDSDMQIDFDDLRFTKLDGATLLDAWLESKIDSTSAVVWVETDTPANGVDADIYMYYGNAGAGSDWDGAATFPNYFDDFSTNTIANYTERYYLTWQQFTYKEVTGGELHIGFDATGYGSAMLFHTASSLTNSGYVMRSRFRASGYYSDVSAFRHQKEIGLTTDTTPTYISPCSCDPDFAGWHSDGCIDMPDNHCQTTAISGTTTDELAYSLDGSTYYPGFWVQDIDSGSNASELWVDWALVRKYVTNPATYGFGGEESWLSGWGKRKKITLTGDSSGAQTNYQLKLTVAYDSDMQADFDDLRFTQSDGETLVDAWLESKVDSTSATVWVEFPTTPANGITEDYYMYYGNSGAVSNWDIETTFLLGDDFPGSSIDTGKWDGKTSNAAVSGGIMSYGGDSTQDPMHSITQFGANTSCRSKIKFLTPASYIDYFGFSDLAMSHYSRLNIIYNGSNRMRTRDGVTMSDVDTNNPLDTWFITDINVLGGTNVSWFYDDVEGTNSPKTTNPPNANDLEISWLGRSTSACIQSEWIIVRKYVTNPATYGFGGEESGSLGNSYWYYNLLKRRN